MKGSTKSDDLQVIIKYENADLAPAYAEGAQGMLTPKGALHVSFYSEYLKHQPELECNSQPMLDGTVQAQTPDPYSPRHGKFHIVRRVESSLILPASFLRDLIPWLQSKLNELDSSSKG